MTTPPTSAQAYDVPAYRLARELDELQLAQQPIYNDPTEHVREELQRLALLIELRGLILKTQGDLDGHRFRGLLLRDGELERLLKRATQSPSVATDDPEVARKHYEFERLTRRITLREAATVWSVANNAGGCELPLLEAARHFRLNRFQYHVIVLALTPEVDLSFQKMFSYLLNDVTKKRPTVSLALDLFGGDAVGRREGRTSFMPGSPLVDFNLLQIGFPQGTLEPSLLMREFKMPERMVSWFLGTRTLSPEMRRFAHTRPGIEGLEGLIYAAPLTRRIQALLQHLQRHDPTSTAPTPLIALSGPDGVGKRSMSQCLSAAVNHNLLVIDLAAAAFPPNQRDDAFRNILREAHLHHRALCLANFSNDLVQARACPPLSYLYGILRQAPGIGILTSTSADIGLSGAGRGFSTRLGLEIPDLFGRTALWEHLIKKSKTPVDEDLDLRDFSLKYGFTGGGILRVLAHAREEATMRTANADVGVSSEDLDNACRVQLGQGLSGVATRVRQKATLNDIVLNEDIRNTVQEIIKQARYRNVVFHEWGFGQKLKSGKGLSVLFAGPPGTGKTMVAGVIASELRMELFKVDLSQVVSKYIGETEKNLSKVFDAAEGNQFIILFDEADSLFSKRTEVKSSVDRYANLEVNYLLQKIEDYGGMCILTTNFDKGIDDAFKRRLNFRVTFPFPEKEDRELIWEKLLPDAAPRDEEIDYEWLAERYELSGGNIKNAVLRAAFWAASKHRGIVTEDLELAAEKESREIGKLVVGVGYK